MARIASLSEFTVPVAEFRVELESRGFCLQSLGSYRYSIYRRSTNRVVGGLREFENRFSHVDIASFEQGLIRFNK
jgi:predicted HTH domain antitoxin